MGRTFGLLNIFGAASCNVTCR